MNKILCIGATHGDEAIGVQALKELEKNTGGFDWIIGNEKAYEQNTRLFEGDLNRSAPGKFGAQNYAPRRAAEIIQLSQNYTYTIDLHGTRAQTGIFVIVTNPKKENLELAVKLGIKKIVIWPAISLELAGPLSECFPCGVEIECGPRNSIQTQNELVLLLKSFIQNKNIPITKKEINSCVFYEVYDKLCDPSLAPALIDFKETNIEDEIFVPLLVGQYEEVTCYKMRILSQSKINI